MPARRAIKPVFYSCGEFFDVSPYFMGGETAFR